MVGVATMPFGKYRGEELSEIPTGYLMWLWHNVEMRTWLKGQVRDELQDRGEYVEDEFEERYTPPPVFTWSTPGLSVKVDPEDHQLFRELVDGGYKALARRYHPDFGGSEEVMRQVNNLAEKLRRQLPAKQG